MKSHKIIRTYREGISTELNINICRGLINLKRKFAKKEYRLLYNLINEKDKAATPGLYFSDLPPTDIKYRNENNQTQIIKIVDIQDLFNKLNDDFEANKYYGVYYMPYVNAINEIKEISQELVLNAIAHGDLSKEIKIEFKDGVFPVQNFFSNLEQAKRFFLSVKEHKIQS